MPRYQPVTLPEPLLVYAEDTRAVTLDLSGLDGSQPVVAVAALGATCPVVR